MGDKKAIRRATGETAEGVIRLIDESIAHYHELGVILMLTGEEYRQRWSVIQSRHSSNPDLKQLIQSADGVRFASIRAENRLEMLRAATACMAEGRREPRALQAYFEATPFHCACFPRGFELSCRFEYPGRPRIALLVGECHDLRRWIRKALAMVNRK